MNALPDDIPEDLPDPVLSGNAGTQEATPKGEPTPIAVVPVHGSVTNTAKALIAARPRALGQEAVGPILLSYMAEQNDRLALALEDIRQERKFSNSAYEKLSLVEKRNAVLETKMEGEANFRNFRGAFVVMGGLLIGVGGTLLGVNEAKELGWLVLSVGALLIVLSWVPLFKGEKAA